MERSIRRMIARMIDENIQINRVLKSTPMVVSKKENSLNKTKAKKHTKSKPRSQYKSTKPVKSKAVTQFRNKSNI